MIEKWNEGVGRGNRNEERKQNVREKEREREGECDACRGFLLISRTWLKVVRYEN